MVLTRNQIENLTREELIEELLKLFAIRNQLKYFNNRFETFALKRQELKSELFITLNFNSVLHQQIIQLEQMLSTTASITRENL